MMKKLNLGCGQNKLAGYINVDKYDSFSPEVIWDLEKIPWPFEDNSVEEIIACHCLEHMGAQANVFLSIIQELYRICCPNARIIISVPHPRCDDFIDDPTHVRPITEGVLSLFSKKKNQEWKASGASNTPLATYLNVDFEIEKVHYNFCQPWIDRLKTKAITAEELTVAANGSYNVLSEIKIIWGVRK